MAMDEQLRRIKASVEGWNSWRSDNPDAEIDLRDAKCKIALTSAPKSHQLRHPNRANFGT